MERDDYELLGGLRENIIALCDQKFSQVVQIEHKMATFFHPNLKRFNFIKDEDERKAELNEVKSKTRMKMDDLQVESCEEVIEKSPKRSKNQDSAFEIDSDDPDDDEQEDELEKYWKEKVKIHTDNPLNYWEKSQFGKLKEIAAEVFSLSASSAGSERSFSYSGKILRKERYKMNPETISSLTIYTNNIKNKTIS